MKRTLIRMTTVALLAFSLTLPATVHAHQDRGRGPLGAELQRIRARDAGTNRFRPASVSVQRGTRVRWVNAGTLTHTTTSNTGIWDERLSPGDTFTRRFRRAGTFRFHCSIHAEMTGTIIVT